MNYYRITAYHPAENVSAILDSHGRFEKLWEFSAYLVSKGFKILEASKEDAFEDGNIYKAPFSRKILMRAVQKGECVNKKTQFSNNHLGIQINNFYYTLK